jgi:disulfide oxidoreductase YuzD
MAKEPLIRGRRQSRVDPDAIASVVDGLEAPTAPATVSWKERAKSRKIDAYNFRFNDAQRRLLDHAKEETGKSYQRLIEELVWPVLEEQFGDQVRVEN